MFREWWTRWEGATEANGRCEVRAFYGTHRVTVNGQEKVVNLDKAAGSATVSFR